MFFIDNQWKKNYSSSFVLLEWLILTTVLCENVISSFGSCNNFCSMSLVSELALWTTKSSSTDTVPSAFFLHAHFQHLFQQKLVEVAFPTSDYACNPSTSDKRVIFIRYQSFMAWVSTCIKTSTDNEIINDSKKSTFFIKWQIHNKK